MHHRKFVFVGLGLAGLTILLDQLSKIAILKTFKHSLQPIRVTSFFDLILTWNKGVSFSLFNSYGDTGTLMLILLSSLITVGLLIWLFRSTNIYLSCGLGLIIGGALGNLIDRIYFKAVIDFLYFHLATFAWPAFNIADTAITIGVVLILIESFVIKKGDQSVKSTRN